MSKNNAAATANADNDKIPEIQSSFVAAFLKQKLGKEALVSTNFRKEYSKCLTLFLFYLTTIAKHTQSDSKKKLTKACILKALSDIGFEDFSEQLGELQIDFKNSSGQTAKPINKVSAAKQTTAETDEGHVAERMDQYLQNMTLHAESGGNANKLEREDDGMKQNNEDEEEDEEDNVASDDEEVDNIPTEEQQQKTEVVVVNNLINVLDAIIGQNSNPESNIKPYKELF